MAWADYVQLSAIVVCALIVIALVYFVWRRRRLVSGRGAFECYHRKAGLKEQARWHHGIVRYRRDAVVWFPLVAFGFKPGCVVPRLRVQIGPVRQPTERESVQLYEGQNIVTIRAAGADAEACEWAMAPSAANGLMAWAESAPPGEGQYGHTKKPGGGVAAKKKG